MGGRIRGIAGGKVNAGLIGKLPKLEIIAHSGVGTDSIDLNAARARGVRVTNTPDVLNDAVAELTIGLMLALGRRLPQADRYIRDGGWHGGMYPLTGELNRTHLVASLAAASRKPRGRGRPAPSC